MCCLFFNKKAQNEYESLVNSGRAFISEIKFKPYWNLYFHFSSIFTFVGHFSRCVWHLLSLAVTLITSPFLIFMPWKIPSLPAVIIEQAATTLISAAAMIVQPCFFIIRTFLSIILGYQECSDLDWDWCTTEASEREDWQAQMYPF